MAQVVEEKGSDQQQRNETSRDVKPQVESEREHQDLSHQPLFPGARTSEKFPETRVGETLLCDDAQRLEAKESGREGEAGKKRGGDSDVGVMEQKEEYESLGGKKAMSTEETDGGKSGSSSDEAQGGQDRRETKVKKLTGSGIPRGKPNFRVSANPGNRGLGENAAQPPAGNGLRGGPGGGGRGGLARTGSGLARTGSGLARTGSGLARTGSGVPQMNSDLKDFAAAFLEHQESDANLPPSSGPGSKSERKKQTDPLKTEQIAGNASHEGEGGLYNGLLGKAASATDAVKEKVIDLKTGFVSTIKDQLLPVKDPEVESSNMEVDEKQASR